MMGSDELLQRELVFVLPAELNQREPDAAYLINAAEPHSWVCVVLLSDAASLFVEPDFY